MKVSSTVSKVLQRTMSRSVRRELRASSNVFVAAVVGILVLCASRASAQSSSELFIIDFESESLPEGTEISTQYADLGVTFSIEKGKGALPIIAVEGGATVAFWGPDPDNPNVLADTPMCIGVAGLTDPIVGGDFRVGQNIVITFDPPVTQVRLFVIDIDFSESFTLTAFDDEGEVDCQTRPFPDEEDTGTGDGVSTEFSLSAESITSVILEVPQEPAVVGFAIDYLTFTRPCTGSGCNSLFEIMQESELDLGDFDNHFLGVLLAHPTQASAAEVYAYDCPKRDSWNGSLLNPESDRSHLLLAETTDGLTLFIVHDLPDDESGGAAEMKFELSDDPDGAFISVEDGPSDDENDDVYTSEQEGTLFTFTSVHSWIECCTDGLALSGLDGDWSMLLQFTEVDGEDKTSPIGGLDQWVAYSADGSQIPLELELGRRVLLRPLTDCNGNGIADALDIENCPEGDPTCQDCNGNSIPDECDLDCNENGVPEACECLYDVDGSGDVGPFDLAILLGAWGPVTPESACLDADENGFIEAFDLAVLLGAWGPCE